jgi:NitT/TauT family transport system substrate-binding protein
MTVIVAAAVVTACSSSSGSSASSSGSAPELANLTIPALEIPDAITLTIAKDKGFFKAQGLNVTIQTVASSNLLTPELLSHQYGITTENYVGMYEAEMANPSLQFRVIADDLQAAPGVFELMVPKGSKVTSPAQLSGKTIAFPGLGTSIGTLAVNVLLNSYHVSSTAYKPVAVPFPNMPAAMAKGEFDAAFVTEPFITIMEAAGARPLADVMTGPMANFPISCWAVTGWFATKYPKTVAAFTRAIDQANQLAVTDQPLVRQELPTYIKGLKPQIANVMGLGTFNTTLSLTRMERVADVMEQYSDLPKGFDVKSMLVTQSTSGS